MPQPPTQWIERLETRQFLSGTASALPPPAAHSSISGVVYNDANGNGVRGASEAGIGAVVIELSRYAGGSYVPIATTKTTSTGSFAFSHLAGGSYIVWEKTPSGFRITAPGLQQYRVGLTGANAIVSADFGDTQLGLIGGLITSSATHAPLPGQTVLLETTAGKILAQTQSDATGRYAFKTPAGVYRVVQPAAAGEKAVTPAGGVYARVVLASGGISSKLDFVDAPLIVVK